MVHIKPLDSLRALAVIVVVASHWYTPPLGSVASAWNDVAGSIAVDVFFVLSGFLITKILLEQRFKAELDGTTTSALIKKFYIRRTLRIFPIYYIFVFAIAIYQLYTLGYLKHEVYYYLTYTANFHHFFEGAFTMTAGQLWSLAVEEQFYLIWPWLILLTPKEKLVKMIVLFIFIGVSSKYILHSIANHTYITLCCFDALGAGGLLAWLTVTKPEALTKLLKPAGFLALLGLALIALGLIVPSLNFIPLRVKGTLIGFYLILYLFLMNDKEQYPLRFFFLSPVMRYIGRISYGIYLYHVSVPFIWKYIPQPLQQALPAYVTHEGVWIPNMFFLLTLASASYFFIEKPFLNLKKKYN